MDKIVRFTKLGMADNLLFKGFYNTADWKLNKAT